MENLIRLGLAALLLSCLADMPYGYYQLVRFLAMVGFGYLAYQAQENKRAAEAVALVLLALLFQPLLKVSLGRTLWNVVDVAVAIWLLTKLNSNKD